MALGLFVLRVVVGGLFIGHGAQKLFGFFGGHGLQGTGAHFDALGFRPGRTMALAAGLAELIGGALFALGLVTPLAAVLLIAVMTTAIGSVHWRGGLWATNGGFEYNLVLVAVAFAVTSIGAGNWSLDHALGLDVTGPQWALVALVVGALVGIAGISARRPRTHKSADPEPARA
jgi:putative oxidoreductase